MKNEIILFNSTDGETTLEVSLDKTNSNLWLNRQQLSELYNRDVKTIDKHVTNALREEMLNTDFPVVAKFATTATYDGNKPLPSFFTNNLCKFYTSSN